jgi:hypothetical protein
MVATHDHAVARRIVRAVVGERTQVVGFELAAVGHRASVTVLDHLASTTSSAHALAAEAFACATRAARLGRATDWSVRAAVGLAARAVRAARDARRDDSPWSID